MPHHEDLAMQTAFFCIGKISPQSLRKFHGVLQSKMSGLAPIQSEPLLCRQASSHRILFGEDGYGMAWDSG